MDAKSSWTTESRAGGSCSRMISSATTSHSGHEVMTVAAAASTPLGWRVESAAAAAELTSMRSGAAWL